MVAKSVYLWPICWVIQQVVQVAKGITEDWVHYILIVQCDVENTVSFSHLEKWSHATYELLQQGQHNNYPHQFLLGQEEKFPLCPLGILLRVLSVAEPFLLRMNTKIQVSYLLHSSWNPDVRCECLSGSSTYTWQPSNRGKTARVHRHNITVTVMSGMRSEKGWQSNDRKWCHLDEFFQLYHRRLQRRGLLQLLLVMIFFSLLR
jgi:hypothetical protein